MMESNLNQVSGQEAKLFKKPLPWFILALILVVVAVALYFMLKGLGDNLPEDLPVITKQAPKGQILEEFPAGLIVDENAVITGSAENDGSENASKQVLVTSYRTNLSASVVNKRYVDYFAREGWRILANQQGGGQFNISAGKDSFGSVQVNYFQDKESNLVVLLLNKIK